MGKKDVPELCPRCGVGKLIHTVYGYVGCSNRDCGRVFPTRSFGGKKKPEDQTTKPESE